MTTDFKSLVDTYKPISDTEARDKESFLQFYNAFGPKIWARDNLVGHIASSAWITNPSRDKYLLAHHNLYDVWAWLGGHNDGNTNTLYVCEKEIKEESGVENIRFLSKEIMQLDVIRVASHYKNGIFVPDHLHFNVTYPIEINESERLLINPKENSGLKWMTEEEVIKSQKTDKIIDIYQRLTYKIKKL